MTTKGQFVEIGAPSTTHFESDGSGANPATGPETPKEESAWQKASPWVHGVLGVVSFIPGVSVVSGGLDAAIYAGEGNLIEAGIAAASMIPGGKVVTTAGKVVKGAVGLAKETGTVAKIVKGGHEAEELAKAARLAQEAKLAGEAKLAKEAEEKAAGTVEKNKKDTTIKKKNTGEKGKCGEWLAKMDMVKDGFDEVVAVQNNSGHGVDLIGRNSKTGEVKVWEVKATDGPSAPGLSQAQSKLGGEKFTKDRLGKAVGGKGNYGKVPEAMANAEKALDWIKSATKKGKPPVYEKREVFVGDLEKGCGKHPNRPSKSKPWNEK